MRMSKNQKDRYIIIKPLLLILASKTKDFGSNYQ